MLNSIQRSKTLGKYGKLLTAVIGLVALALNDVWGISALIGMEEVIGNGLVALLTAFGVWAVPNEY